MPLSREFDSILVRATNWVGDAVMSLPALRALRARYPAARITVQARPWVADIYTRERFLDRVILYTAAPGAGDWHGKWRAARALRSERFDCAVLFPNSFDSALSVWLAGIPCRIGYNRDGRGILLTDAVPLPAPGEIPRHERYYYLTLLRRAGLLEAMPEDAAAHLDGASEARAAGEQRFTELGIGPVVIGVSPGAAYGGAKRWLPERFAEAAAEVASQIGAAVAVFGAKAERSITQTVVDQLLGSGVKAFNLAGETGLRDFVDLAAACRVFITNDSGAMHVAAALGVPTVAVFGSTDHAATGPSGPLAQVVREPVECSPCLLRECPIDHRCMTRVSVGRVARAALDLLK